MSADAQSVTYPSRRWTDQAGDATVSLGGQAFVNHGLVGVGRLSAATRDFRNETLGSFSSMALDPSSWRRLVGAADYANRIHTHRFTLRPYVGDAPAPSAATQVTIRPAILGFQRRRGRRRFALPARPHLRPGQVTPVPFRADPAPNPPSPAVGPVAAGRPVGTDSRQGAEG